jgi:MFS family permease
MTIAAIRPEPSRAYRWAVLLFLSLAMFGNYYIYDSINPLVDIFAKDLGFSDQVIGWLNSSYSLAAVLTLFISGIMIDRLGTRPATMIFAILCLLGALLTAVSPKAPVMIAGRFILGIGAESLIVAVTTALAKWFKGKELSFAFGVNLTIARLASYAADYSPKWAAPAFAGGWQPPLWIAVGAGVICVVAAGVYWAQETHAQKNYSLGSGGKPDKLVWSDLVKFDRSYWYIVALCVTFYSAIFPFRTFAVKFFLGAHQGQMQGIAEWGRNLNPGLLPTSPLEAAGFLNSTLPLAAMIATPLFGLLVDRVGKRALFMMFGSLLLMPVYLIMAYTDTPLFVPIALMGIAFSLIPAVMWPSVAYLVEERRLGSAYALMTLIQQVGLFILNWMVGWANDYRGASEQNPQGYALGMIFFSVLGFVGFFFSYMLRRSETSGHSHGLETITTTSSAHKEKSTY